MHITFRQLQEADLDIASDILVQAYGFTGNRRTMLYHFWLLQPDGWWLMLADDEPVGYGGAVDYGPFSSIGMLSVYPSMQNKGIGRAMVEQIMAWITARGCPTMVLEAAERAASLYRRLGFTEEDVTHNMHRDAIEVPPQPQPGVVLLQAADISELVEFDAQYFGAKREKIFTSPMVYIPDHSFLTRNDAGRITGYIFAESGYFGPWVADNAIDAEKLLLHALSLPLDHGATACIPAQNTAGLDILTRHGFTQKSFDHHMRYGKPSPTRRAMIYAETSPALG